MLLKLVLPTFSGDITGGTIVRWHVQEGEAVAFGEDLFDLLVSERVMMRRRLAAHFVLRSSSAKPSYFGQPAEMFFRVVSADAAVVREIKVRADQDLRVGGVAAVLSIDEGDATETGPEALEKMPEMRVTVNLIEGADRG